MRPAKKKSETIKNMFYKKIKINKGLSFIKGHGMHWFVWTWISIKFFHKIGQSQGNKQVYIRSRTNRKAKNSLMTLEIPFMLFFL